VGFGVGSALIDTAGALLLFVQIRTFATSVPIDLLIKFSDWKIGNRKVSQGFIPGKPYFPIKIDRSVQNRVGTDQGGALFF
jgi:hypothetical protein